MSPADAPLRVSSQQVFGAAFDGRWLVFSIWDRPTTGSSWTMYAWDSDASAVPRELGRAAGGAGLPDPIVHNGWAFWTIAREPQNRSELEPQHSEVHMTELGTGRDSVIGTGLAGSPFRFASLVVWSEMSAQTTTMQLKAVSIATGEPAALPVELRGPLSRPGFVNGDVDTYVWSTENSTTLRAWRAAAADAVTIISRAPQGQYLQWPQVGGPLVAWDNGAAQFVADLRSGSYAQITPEYGGVKLSGDALVVTYAPTGKSSHPVLDSTLIRPSQLPALPACN